jgi:hypothetical protein
MYSTVLYTHAIDVLSVSLGTESSDRVASVLGVSRAFANSSDATKHSRPDDLLAVYIARRDKNDGSGPYSRLAYGLRQLQAATKAGVSTYNADAYSATSNILYAVEYGISASVVNYCYSVLTTMSATTVTEANKASALHANSEAVGFLLGLRFIPQERRRITTDQIDKLLLLLNVPGDAAPTPYTFVTDPVNELPSLTQAIAQLKSIYGFTDAELEDFKKNWIREQGR